MPSNYELITEENIRDRGEKFDDIGEFLAEQFYSDQTHFVYELLQNAQDAIKRRSIAQPENSFPKNVYFNIFPDRLEMHHYGQVFNEMDVRGISDILKGTKKLDNKQIGRFGIGFKSVYTFTESPEIHSGDEHFVIERYIRPRLIPPVHLEPGETLFIFPFNHKEKNKSEIYELILNRLTDLGLRTLLFLDEIDQILWDKAGKQSGAYIREKKQIQNNVWQVTLFGEDGKKTSEENWLIFQQPVDDVNSNVEIGYNLVQDEKTKKNYIKPVTQSNLYAYFETARETRLGFLIQGHYHTTPTRDNITSDEINKKLISETAKLLIRSLEILKSMGLLNADTLELMPINSDYFPSGNLFKPIYDEFLHAMMTLDFLPSYNGKFIKAEEAKLARGTELIQLLSSDSLRALFGFSEAYHWLSDDITRDKTPELREFLLNDLDIEEIDPERFARNITQNFLECQSDKWLIKFYKFLDGQKALWRSKTYSIVGILRYKPFIRTENDKMTAPFDTNENPLVFLPGSDETDFPVVKNSIVKNKDALKFLNNLGLCEPDLVDEVLNYVVPRYSNEELEISDTVHLKDLLKIKSALDTATGSKKERLLNQLKETHFIKALDQGNYQRRYKKPTEIYIDDEGLRSYFDGNPEIWFYDGMIYLRYKKLLEDIGANCQIRMLEYGNKIKYKTLEDYHGWHVRGIEGFNPDWEVEGLSFAIKNPNHERSKYIWENILRPNIHLISGMVESSTNREYYQSTIENKTSKAGDLAKRGKWLPDKNGKFHKPSELSLDDLPEEFFKDEGLARKLGMKEVRLRAFAQERGVDENSLNLAIEWIKSDPDSFRKFASKTLERPLEESSPGSFNFLSDLQKTFEKPSDEFLEDDEEESEPTNVQDPERRRRKVNEDILISLLNELENQQRFRRIPSLVWEKKDNRVRSFLMEEYHGHCQICGSTFKKRNGFPYFEGLYLVSRINARYIDRPGNVLSLCPTCCAKFQHGEVITEDIVNQIQQCRLKKEGGTVHPSIIVELCGEQVEIHYTERHILDLQEIIKASKKKSNKI